jgi:hypothetical protein
MPWKVSFSLYLRRNLLFPESEYSTRLAHNGAINLTCRIDAAFFVHFDGTMNPLSALGFPRFPYSRGAREHCLCSIIPGMSSDKFASASRSFSLSTQLEATETSGSDSDIPLAKMADSESLLADARQRVANLEKEERLLKLRKEKDQVDSMARKLKEEVERAEKAVRKEKSNWDRLLDPGTPEPARKLVYSNFCYKSDSLIGSRDWMDRRFRKPAKRVSTYCTYGRIYGW